MFICTSIYIVSDHPYYCMLIISVSFLYLYIVSDHPYNAKIICFVLCSYMYVHCTVYCIRSFLQCKIDQFRVYMNIILDHPYYVGIISFVFIYVYCIGPSLLGLNYQVRVHIYWIGPSLPDMLSRRHLCVMPDHPFNHQWFWLQPAGSLASGGFSSSRILWKLVFQIFALHYRSWSSFPSYTIHIHCLICYEQYIAKFVSCDFRTYCSTPPEIWTRDILSIVAEMPKY